MDGSWRNAPADLSSRLRTDPFPMPDFNVVVSFAAACEAANLSISTMRRLVRNDRGPRILKLSDRRIGIRRSDLDEWLNSRKG